ncbi:MAG: HDOD domain-containing protein [Gammaproteobacteria bacterium]|nr:HDOD domain-containing protein [Gammaproteobacteria bacterium]
MPIDIAKLKMPTVSPDGLIALELIESGDYDMPDLNKIVSQDPTLSATLLKYANSPMYAPVTEVTNVGRAMSVLGAKTLRAAIMIATMRGFTDPSEASQHLWEHSQAVSKIAKLIAKRHYPRYADDIELSALLHDMGALVLASNYPEQYSEIAKTALSPENTLTLSQLEQEAFGVVHDQVTAVFISTCRLPEVTGQILADFYSRPPLLIDTQDAISQQIAIIALAHLLEEQINSHKTRFKETIPNSMESLLLHLSLSTDDIENFIEDYDEICQTEG